MTAVTSTIELAVGIVCLVGAVAAWRRALRGAAVVLAIAGITATAHALWAFPRS